MMSDTVFTIDGTTLTAYTTLCKHSRHKKAGNMANDMGKRYTCGNCGSQVIVTKAGDGGLICCDKPMDKS
tara:strand:- start:158 stop:367 length:210 start_codon:yes stop_codon:yes gene_type:complete